MGNIGLGYGSEFHLLRMLGRHRAEFDDMILKTLAADAVEGVKCIEWLDQPYDIKDKTKDGELKSVDFLDQHGGADWKQFWPDPKAGRTNREGVPSWDAVARLRLEDGHTEWLLVEAKAHLGELDSPSYRCRAEGSSRAKIEDSLHAVFKACDGSEEEWNTLKRAWLGRCYQVANRLACLHFLVSTGHPTRLLLVHFVKDTSGKRCPAMKSEWLPTIEEHRRRMGLPCEHALSSRIHYVFPQVCR